jgi:hypothetical protein
MCNEWFHPNAQSALQRDFAAAVGSKKTMEFGRSERQLEICLTSSNAYE